MRTGLVLALFFCTLAAVRAQEQDRKLLDRILKPNTSIESNEQGRQFTAGGQVMTKKAPVRWFFVKQRSAEKQFAGTQEFRAKEFNTKSSRFAGQKMNLTTRSQLTRLDRPYSTTAYVTGAAREDRRAVETNDYAGVRPFLGRGKSQKAISAQDRPLTIDQVRELLNKNN